MQYIADSCTGHGESHQALLDPDYSDYGGTVIRGHPTDRSEAPPSVSSIFTIRASPSAEAAAPEATSASALTIDSYRTASSTLSSTAATEGGSMHVSPSALVHRFSLIKPGARKGASTGAGGSALAAVDGWSPFDFFFAGGTLAKCDVCAKRIGWKPALECDDCGLKYARSSSTRSARHG
jgi:LIM domain kinase 1